MTVPVYCREDYCPDYMSVLRDMAKDLGLKYHDGVYALAQLFGRGSRMPHGRIRFIRVDGNETIDNELVPFHSYDSHMSNHITVNESGFGYVAYRDNQLVHRLYDGE